MEIDPHGVPPWRRRDAPPGPIVIVMIIGFTVMIVVLLGAVAYQAIKLDVVSKRPGTRDQP